MIANVAGTIFIVREKRGVSFQECKDLKHFSGLTYMTVTVNLARYVERVHRMSLSLSRNLEERYLLSLAREEIEYLRRLYGKATDSLGKVGDQEATEFGVATFHRIFSADAVVRVTGGPKELTGSGPDSWALVVTNALKDYESTQHLIGTQLVEFTDVQIENGEITGGQAEMSSYLQAWHAWPDRKLRLVLGTYYDKVRFNPGEGWQIFDMTLEYTSVEHRQMGDAT